jgi:hypothetical protein
MWLWTNLKTALHLRFFSGYQLIFTKNSNFYFLEFPLYEEATDEDCVVTLRISNSSTINFTNLEVQVGGDLQQISMTTGMTSSIF